MKYSPNEISPYADIHSKDKSGTKKINGRSLTSLSSDLLDNHK